MIYEDFENILVSKDNTKQNPNESYTNNFQKHVACSYGYKLTDNDKLWVCVDYEFIKTFKSYIGYDVYKFVSSMIEESKYCSYIGEKASYQRTYDE